MKRCAARLQRLEQLRRTAIDPVEQAQWDARDWAVVQTIPAEHRMRVWSARGRLLRRLQAHPRWRDGVPQADQPQVEALLWQEINRTGRPLGPAVAGGYRL